MVSKQKQWFTRAIAAMGAVVIGGILTPAGAAPTPETINWQWETTVAEIPPLEDPEIYLPAEAQVHLVLRLGERRVYVYRGEEVQASYPVAIGTSQTPTPTGTYEVFQMVEDPVWQSPWTGRITEPGPNSALGLRWIGFAQMSNGIIGFHGTPTVNSIGKAASNGCVRMYNHDVVAMFEQVEMGTTVIVEQ
ncbi:MAG: L,D-transpeptidase [Spirulina sp. SIO3F2]|nr:L,D-transpeptidase [Spirulina sp. SIO3F2]